ncbi:MAG TPA: hypothetical protein VEU55_04005 [Gemmatimonadales bacterium]|nr:hypothetical protein [Gemmatimonadales bacterium]
MLPIRPSRWLAAGVAATLLAFVAACNADKTATAPQNPALTAAEASSLGEAMTADAQSELDGVTLSGGGFVPGMAGPFGTPTTMCVPTISPSPVVDTDKDGVPDSIRVTFPGCAFAMGSEADTIRGSIDVADPTPTTADRDLRLRFLDFARIEVANGIRRSIVINGMRQALRDANAITLQDSSLKTVYTFGDGGTATSVRDWTAKFTADVAGSIKSDAPLPSGNLDINGTASWTHGTNTYSLSVTTGPPLHYNSSCTVRPPFDSGKLTLVVTRNSTTSTVTIVFTACGQFTVTRS